MADFLNTKAVREWPPIDNIAYMPRKVGMIGLFGTRRACFAWELCSLLNEDILDNQSGGET
jgi:hypothetical protein